MVNRYGEELAREIPEIDGFVGLDDLRQVDQVVQIGGGPPLPGQSHLVFDHTASAAADHPRLRVPEGRRGVQQPLYLLRHPDLARALPQPVGRQPGGRGARARGGAASRSSASSPRTRRATARTWATGATASRHLVEALLAGDLDPWIRFLYAYPTTLDSELLRLMGQEERFCSYVDMPLQHTPPRRCCGRCGAAAVRSATCGCSRRRASWSPDLFLRTTFIVGFPGETEEHFEHLLEFVERVRFDHLGAFVYSPEEGTPGATLPDRVPKRVARRRYERLLEAQRPIALERRAGASSGAGCEVLVEGVCEETEHLLQARHQRHGAGDRRPHPDQRRHGAGGHARRWSRSPRRTPTTWSGGSWRRSGTSRCRGWSLPK